MASFSQSSIAAAHGGFLEQGPFRGEQLFPGQAGRRRTVVLIGVDAAVKGAYPNDRDAHLPTQPVVPLAQVVQYEAPTVVPPADYERPESSGGIQYPYVDLLAGNTGTERPATNLAVTELRPAVPADSNLAAQDARRKIDEALGLAA
jgi:hypothetical protein